MGEGASRIPSACVSGRQPLSLRDATPYLRRRHRRGRAARRPCPPHAGAAIDHRQRALGRAVLLQVRELPAHGRVQVPRCVQRAVEVRRGAAQRRRDRLLVGQPRAGHRAVGATAVDAGRDRHAEGRPRRQGRGHEGLWRRSGDVRPLHRRPRGADEAARAGARHDDDSALRPPRCAHGAGHGGEGTHRRDRPARSPVRVPRRRRAAVGLGAVGACAVARLQGLRRGARGRQRRPAVAARREDRAHRNAKDHRRRCADAAPGRVHLRHHQKGCR
ncbi:hypothetical protein D9M68_637990 [compost metagenome]